MKKAVVDASVVLKWYLVDETDGETALALMENHSLELMALFAPDLLIYEVANGLVIAGRRGRLSQDKLSDALAGFRALQLTLVDAGRFCLRIPHFCHRYGISAYDAAYAAVAELEKTHLITADEKLYLALKKDFRWVKRLGELEGWPQKDSF